MPEGGHAKFLVLAHARRSEFPGKKKINQMVLDGLQANSGVLAHIELVVSQVESGELVKQLLPVEGSACVPYQHRDHMLLAAACSIQLVRKADKGFLRYVDYHSGAAANRHPLATKTLKSSSSCRLF